ncbi:hypothetical protein S7335_3969 [Synechococcus sp. PCC 7335]|uniref:hypothetical protein n=1 Tax=Synechococcus sp. (strain ATCC 29403 / PCC 7335) TaxID=91464 RepID=UPI00017EDC96|nr:hypothetical protein [Synechococcus sp. PCC 7335]EDX86266.1 hypothetical protein S7335_3969 [Synechococcus sp. PCC 7335]
MPRPPHNKDSRYLMRIGERLRKLSNILVIPMVVGLIVFGLAYLSTSPVAGIFLLICGVVGTIGLLLVSRQSGG